MELSRHGVDDLGIDASVKDAVFLEGGFAIEVRIPNQKYRLAALQMDRHRARIEDRKGELPAIARVDMESRNIDETAELGFSADRDEGQRVCGNRDNLLCQQKCKLTGRDRESFTFAQSADSNRGRVGSLVIGRDIHFGADREGIGCVT